MKRILGLSKFAMACAVTCAFAGYAQDAAAHRRRTASPSPTWIARSSRATIFIDTPTASWIKRTEIPPDRAGVDVFTKLTDLSNKRTADLIEGDRRSRTRPQVRNARKVADLYNSYMDEAAIEAKGLAPLRPHLEAIAAIHDKT